MNLRALVAHGKGVLEGNAVETREPVEMKVDD